MPKTKVRQLICKALPRNRRSSIKSKARTWRKGMPETMKEPLTGPRECWQMNQHRPITKRINITFWKISSTIWYSLLLSPSTHCLPSLPGQLSPWLYLTFWKLTVSLFFWFLHLSLFSFLCSSILGLNI